LALALAPRFTASTRWYRMSCPFPDFDITLSLYKKISTKNTSQPFFGTPLGLYFELLLGPFKVTFPSSKFRRRPFAM
jgi:hypothetical protein